MRHAEALIYVVALLAKFTNSNNAHLLVYEQMSISESYVAAPCQALFTVAASRLNPSNDFAPRNACGL